MPPCLRSESLSSTLPIQLLSSPPPAWLFGPHHSPQSKPVLDKAAVKTRKSRWGKSCGEAFFRRSQILNRSVYSTLALWLGGSRCQYRRQTIGPLAARCPWWFVAKKYIFCRPLKWVGPPGKSSLCTITNPALLTGKIELKWHQSFSEDSLFFSKIHSYKNIRAAF